MRSSYDTGAEHAKLRIADIVQTLRGHHASAMSHIMSGVKIMEGIRQPEEIDPSSSAASARYDFQHAPRENFEVLFNRLDTQVNQVILPCTVRQFVLTMQIDVGDAPHDITPESQNALRGVWSRHPRDFRFAGGS